MNERKKERVQKCIDQFNATCDKLNEKYFDDKNKFSINQSLSRACMKAKDSSCVELYMNFDMNDFCKWHRFVPYKADEYGRNYNARPSSCLNMYLTRCKQDGWLPPNLTFDVWGNKKFTVKFTLKFNDAFTTSDVSDQSNTTTVVEAPNSSAT